MYIACNDTSVIVINFRKSKTHAKTDTYCTANKKKKKPTKVFLYQVQTDTPFYNGTAAIKATRTSSADFRAHRRCLLIFSKKLKAECL